MGLPVISIFHPSEEAASTAVTPITITLYTRHVQSTAREPYTSLYPVTRNSKNEELSLSSDKHHAMRRSADHLLTDRCQDGSGPAISVGTI